MLLFFRLAPTIQGGVLTNTSPQDRNSKREVRYLPQQLREYEVDKGDSQATSKRSFIRGRDIY